MKPVLVLLVAALLAGACSSDGGDDGPAPLGRIDGPARVDPEFRGDEGTDTRSDSDTGG